MKKFIILLLLFISIKGFTIDFKITSSSASTIFTNKTSKASVFFEFDAEENLEFEVFASIDSSFQIESDYKIYDDIHTVFAGNSSGRILNLSSVPNENFNYLIIIVNRSQTITELDYSNNSSIIPIISREAVFDAEITQINTFTFTQVIGNEFSLVPYLKNVGDFETSYQMELYISRDTIIDNNDGSLYFHTTSSLEPNEREYPWIDLSSDTMSGKYYFIAKADPSNLVEESNEDNNVKFISINFLEENFEQKLDSVEVQSNYISAGAEMYFDIYSSNTGTSNPANSSNKNFKIGVYFSIDSIFDNNDVFASEHFESVSSPLSGSDKLSASTIVPESFLSQDKIYMISILDYENDLIMNQTGNDTIITSINLQIPKPEVSIFVDTHYSGPFVYSNPSNYNSSVYVRNSGTQLANVGVNIYFSSDDQLEQTDLLIKEGLISIEPSRFGTESIPYNINFDSLNIPEGIHYIFFVENPNFLYEDISNKYDTLMLRINNKSNPATDVYFEYAGIEAQEVSCSDEVNFEIYLLSDFANYYTDTFDMNTRVYLSNDKLLDENDTIVYEYMHEFPIENSLTYPNNYFVMPNNWESDSVYVIFSINNPSLFIEDFTFNNQKTVGLSIGGGCMVTQENSINENESYFDIFPNPTNSILNINTKLNNGSIIIYDSNGRLVKHHKLLENNFTIDLSMIPNGLYIVNFNNDKGLFSKKLFINK